MTMLHDVYGQPFWRKIVNCVPCTDDTELVTLDCGHQVIRIIPTGEDTIGCAECVHEYLAQERRERLTGNR